MKPICFALILPLSALLCGVPSLAHAEDLGLCVSPVFNDPKQMGPYEIAQPYRLIGEYATNVLDEYPGLIINPTNRNGIYTVSDGEYKKVPDEIASQIDNWGAQKKIVVPPFNSDELPEGFTHNDMRSEFYPELGLFLTRNADSIWYRRPDQNEWQRYVKAARWFGFHRREMGGSWEPPKVWRNSETGMVVMDLGPRLILVGTQVKVGEDLSYEYHTLRAGRFIDPIYHETSKNLLFWRDDRNLYQLTLDGIERVELPWSTPPSPVGGTKSWHYPTFSQTDPRTGDVLFRHFMGMARYDGRKVTDISHWNTSIVSKYTDIVWLANKRYAVNKDGIFQLDDELRMSLIDVPSAMRHGELLPFFLKDHGYSYSDEFQRIFMSNPRNGRIFTTIDFSEFHEVQNPTGAPIENFVSDITNESAALILGSDGLYQVTFCDQ